MKRRTKWMYLLTLLIISLLQMAFNRPLVGLILMIFSLISFIVIEKREMRRQFYRCLRYLYVCTDIQAYREEVNRYKASRIVVNNDAYLVFLNLLNRYYSGERVGLWDELNALNASKDLEFWKESYLWQLQKELIRIQNMERMIRYVPSEFKGLAEDRWTIAKVLSQPKLTEAIIHELRETVGGNLMIAELTIELSKLADTPRLKQYYQHAAQNLSKNLSL